MIDKTPFHILELAIKSACHSSQVYYVANPGNWGDALIRKGTLKYFKDMHLEFSEVVIHRILRILPFIKHGTILYGGGGGWCTLFNHSVAHVRQLAKRLNVLVLPSTYECFYEIRNVAFFCRDYYESLSHMPSATFCHDMAFYLDPIEMKKGSGIGYFFRTNRGSARRISIPEMNSDVSRYGNEYSDISEFIRRIAQYRIVLTDRLHVAIAGCLLEREVHLYPGSYFKNRSVYLSSMKNAFSNIYFHEDWSIQV